MSTQHFGKPSEEAFVLATLKEFVKLWGSGCQASFQLECKDKQASIHFSSQLGSPADIHFVPDLPPHGFHEDKQPRHKGPAQRDRVRAAAHKAKQHLLEHGKPADEAAEEESTVSVESNNGQISSTPAPGPPQPSPHQATAAAAPHEPDAVPAVPHPSTP